MKHYTWLNKTTAIVNALSLVFQLLYPGLFVLATTSAKAAGIPAASISFDGGKNTFHLSVSTQQEVKYSLWYTRENGPTEIVNGTETKTPQFEKEIYAGTCSNGICVSHQVKKGLLKWSAGVMQGAIVFVVDQDNLSVKSTYGIDKFDLTPDEEKWLNETDSSPPTSSLAAPTVETPKECLAEGTSITTGGDWIWKIDSATGMAETKEVVKLGMKYVFPQNNNVSVTFNCLPKDESLRTTLKIQQIKTADLKLPSDMTNVGEYAYDITTGMEDGTFNYDVTLPKAGDGDSSVSYIEKPLETAKNYQIGAAEVRRISDSNLSESGSQVKASNLDHFTIYIVTTSGNAPTLSTALVNGQTQVTVPPSTSITIDVTIKTDGGGSANNWKSTGYQVGSLAWQCANTPNYTWGDFTTSESFNLTAPAIPETYSLTLKAYNDENCTGGVSVPHIMDNAITVASPPPSLIPPVLTDNPADDYSLTSVTGIWTSISGGSGYEGIGTSEVHWGNPSGSTKSGLEFTNSGTQSFNSGETFYLGMLTHMNWGTYSGTAANGATLQITLDFNRPEITNPMFSYDFDIEETLNQYGSCQPYQQSSTPCDDKITFPASYGTQSFTIGDVLYTLVIDGFVNAYPSGVAITRFITEEQKDNSAFLVGHLSSVLVEQPDITVTKKTNGQDISSAPGPDIYVGNPVNWTYIIQNTGNVALTEISVIDSPVITISCPSTTLAPGASMTCTASGTATEGQFENTATVMGTTPTNSVVSDTDSSWYNGILIPFCGDGIVNQTSEQCDNALNNGIVCSPSYGSSCDYCSATCQTVTVTGPYCGDGIINGTEQCDGTDLGELPASDFSCTPSCSLELLEDKVTICHATDSHTNPYNVQNPNKSADVSGHDGHNGPIWYPGITVNWGDIIPPFYYVGGHYDGKNWTTEGQEIWENDCEVLPTTGSITITKTAIPSIDTSTWNFTVSGTDGTYSHSLGSGQSHTFSNLQPGSYNISEQTNSGYVTTVQCDGNGPFTQNGFLGSVVAGEDLACVFTNTKKGSISGYKYEDFDGNVNTGSDRFGHAGWTIQLYQNDSLIASTTTNSSGFYTFNNIVPGTYVVKEVQQSGWFKLLPTTDSLTVTVDPGESDSGNNFVNVHYATVKVYKNIDTDADGIVDITNSSDWNWNIDGNGNYTTGSTATSVVPGDRIISEVPQAGYHVTSLICNNGQADNTNYGAVESQVVDVWPWQELVCTFTNTRDVGTLRVVKELTNDNGGNREKDDFSFKIDGGDDIFFNTNGINEHVLPVGSYSVVENATDGYLTSYSNCLPAVVTLGNTTTCTITNDDQPAQLTLIKQVTNNNGGNDSASAWTLTALGSSTISGVTGSSSVTNASVSAGIYTLSESGPTGYEAGDWVCDGGTQDGNQIQLDNGQSATCTITNDDITPTLTVVKNVINDNGGTLTATDFSIKLNNDALSFSTATQSGATTTYVSTPVVQANTSYILSESDLSGYQEGTWSCIDVDTEQTVTAATLNEGQNVRCTITNDDVAPTLRLIKSVRSGDAQPEDFTLTATGTNGFSDVGNSTTFHPIDANTPYTLSESTVEGYSQLGSWSCDQRVNVNRNSQISLFLGQNITCTVTNIRDTGSVKVHKRIDTDANGSFESGDVYAYFNNFRWVLDGSEKIFGDTIHGLATTITGYDHTFDESMPAGYHFVSWYNTNEWRRSCDNPNGTTLPTTIDVTKGRTTEITLCNARDTGTLVAHKFEDNNANQAQDGSESSLTNWDMNLYRGSDCRTGNYLRDLDTNTSGNANFGTLTTGNYSVREELRDGWHNTLPLCQNVTITKDNTSTILFGNYRTGSITIKKFTHPVSTETFTYRGSFGTHTFFNNYDHEYDDLPIGTYTIAEDQENGWYLKDLTCTNGAVSLENRTATISITPGLDVTCTFSNYKMGTIHGEKYFDQDGNGSQGLFEPFMNGWRIFLDEDEDGMYDIGERSEITHGSYWLLGWHDLGDYWFENLMPGEYRVCEEMQSGWVPVSGSNCKTTTIHAEGGDIDIVRFGNWQVGTVTVYKYNDLDGNGEKNDEEVYLSDWTIYLQGDDVASQSAITNASGSAVFTHLVPGQYSVSEDMKTGWEQTGISCGIGEEGLEGATFTLRGGADVVCEIGNRYVTPELTIEKFNNSWPNTVGLGGLVTYTIKVKALKNPVYNVQVRDLLPLDVIYQAGSYQAVSDKHGVLSISEPTYASPGTWTLPTMEMDEEVTLTYIGKVGSDIDAGIYKDVAWARGTEYGDSSSEYVVASAVDEGKIADSFVGTNILVDRSLQENVSVKLTKEMITEGKVLGVTSELPATGQSSWLTIIALVSLASGIGIQFWLLKKSRKQHE